MTPRDGSGEMFDRIAGRYDFVNRVLSLGLDRGWRRRAAAALGEPLEGELADLATGTADLAIEVARRHAACSVRGLDPSPNMLAIGRGKVEAAGLSARVRLEEGSAERLPFEDGALAGVTMAFGIRNVPDRAGALAEIRRALRPGARLVVLELTEPEGSVLGALARFHIHSLVPRAGALLSGAREYAYLARSIGAFPPGARFGEEISRAGLALVAAQPLTFGACHLFVAERPR